jgi:hypothetical protein
MSLKRFTGFRGVACLAEVGKVQFVLIASTPKKLEAVYNALLPNAPAFDPAMCQKSVMIQSAVLPETSHVTKTNQP